MRILIKSPRIYVATYEVIVISNCVNNTINGFLFIKNQYPRRNILGKSDPSFVSIGARRLVEHTVDRHSDT